MKALIKQVSCGWLMSFISTAKDLAGIGVSVSKSLIIHG